VLCYPAYKREGRGVGRAKVGGGGGGGVGGQKKPKIRDSHTSFCQITSLVGIGILTCLQIVYVYICIFNTYSKGVFMCIVMCLGKLLWTNKI
jgi:hypothetical protein